MSSLLRGIKEVSIHIGGVFASREPTVVRTVLGSCVSACLFDPLTRIGGMNHFLLPEGDGDEGLPTRYGIHAMEVLINEVMKLGGERRRLHAKVFGGGHVLHMERGGMGVPERNVFFIKQFLATEGIPILSQRLGGVHPLQVYFFTHTARVLVKPLGKDTAKEVVVQEGRYKVEIARQLHHLPQDSVTLF